MVAASPRDLPNHLLVSPPRPSANQGYPEVFWGALNPFFADRLIRVLGPRCIH